MRIPDSPPDIDELASTRLSELSGAMADPRFREIVAEAGERHRHWNKIRYIARSRGLDPELIWLVIKLGRLGQYRTLPFRGANDEPVRFMVPDAVQQELTQIDRHLGGTLVAGEDQMLSRAARERFVVNTFREEAIASSMLEGASSTKRVALEMLCSGRKPRSRGEKMILNNFHAIQFVREHVNTPLSMDLLLELHTILTKDTLDDPGECGRLRTDADEIVIADQYGTVLYDPPPSAELGRRIDTLCDFANSTMSEGPFVHPVIRACAMHFQIGVDHPFCDGNGRTARIIFYWHMLRNGYWLFEYLPLSKLIYQGPAKYLRAFMYAESDEYDLTYFLNYKMQVIRRARTELAEYIKKKQQELADARHIFAADSHLNHRQREVVIQAIKDPHRIFTIAEHSGSFSVSYGTANTDLNRLAEMGYLNRRILSGKKYSYVRGPKIDHDQAGLPFTDPVQPPRR